MKASDLIKEVEQIMRNVGGDPDVVVCLFGHPALPSNVQEVRYWPINQGYLMVMGETARTFAQLQEDANASRD
jgi:hypothetical protein